MTTEHMAIELASQPETWTRPATLRRAFPAARCRQKDRHPRRRHTVVHSRVVRGTAGKRRPRCSDAFAASEAFVNRDYDAIIDLTRSGTTAEALELVQANRGRTLIVGIVGDAFSPLVDQVDDVTTLPFADAKSVVETMFASTALALLRSSFGQDLNTVMTDSDRAIAASQSWTESYPAMEHGHGPSSIAATGRVAWLFGKTPARLENAAGTGARFVTSDLDPLAELIRAQKLGILRARAKGPNSDFPRHLARCVILDS
jgi:glucosamine 6-phosphate synthetase-like amidotransferase/phosphosugar isomerase protein